MADNPISPRGRENTHPTEQNRRTGPHSAAANRPGRRRAHRGNGATLKDIAELTGLSVSTVSRALSRNPVIPAPTREIVEKAAAELKYRPNAQARALRNARTNIIGVLVPDIQNPFFSTLAASIHKAAYENGFSMLLSHTDEKPDRLNRALEMLGRQRVDGIIVVPHIQSARATLELHDSGMPIVAADRLIPHSIIPSVTADAVPGITDALMALSSLPNAKIGYLAGPQDTSTGQERLNLVKEISKEMGLEPPTIFFGGYQELAGLEGTIDLLEQGVNCILASDTMMTTGAVEALREKNLKIGKHVALVGYDDTQLFRLQNPPLSVIDQNVTLIGKKAFEMLYDYITLEKAPKSMKIPSIYRGRGSTMLAP